MCMMTLIENHHSSFFLLEQSHLVGLVMDFSTPKLPYCYTFGKHNASNQLETCRHYPNTYTYVSPNSRVYQDVIKERVGRGEGAI